jgi:hypothetical protein
MYKLRIRCSVTTIWCLFTKGAVDFERDPHPTSYWCRRVFRRPGGFLFREDRTVVSHAPRRHTIPPM